MGERVYLVVDGVDGRVHHLEFADPARIEDVRRGMIVEVAPMVARPRAADLNIADMTDGAGIYRPSAHLERARQQIERIGGDPEAFVRSHVRRLEALRRAGHVERLDADQWRVPADISERGMRYDLSRGGDGLAVRTLSTLDLKAQVGSDGATWLDRELVSRSRTPLAGAGFGRDVADAMAAPQAGAGGHGPCQPPAGRRNPRARRSPLAAGARRSDPRRPGDGRRTRPDLPAGQNRRICQRQAHRFDPTRQRPLRHDREFSGDRVWVSASCRGSRCSTNGSASTSPGPSATAAVSSGASDANVGWGCESGHPR